MSAAILPINTGYTSSSGAPSGGSLMYHTNNQAINDASGAFVQAEYQLSDQLKLTAGLRFSKDFVWTAVSMHASSATMSSAQRSRLL